jgi:hypothetical protein
MYTSIYQNSYVILVITFIAFSLICYIFRIGYNTEIRDNKVVKKFSWKYPLAISLVVWVFWHFYLYPPAENIIQSSRSANYSRETSSTEKIPLQTPNKLTAQKINMTNWN